MFFIQIQTYWKSTQKKLILFIHKYKQVENSNKSNKYEQIHKLTLQQEKLSFKI
jgi:hypothetical protein